MNILIFPDGDRHRICDLIYHHNYIGNKVYFPVFGIDKSIDWKRCAQWPILLTTNTQTSDLNIDLYKLESENLHLGEDYFIDLEPIIRHNVKDVACSFIDPLSCDIKIDIVHFLLDGGSSADSARRNYINKICQKHNAKQVSSAMVPFRNDNLQQNALIGIPSICETREYLHKFSMCPTDYEFKILGVDLDVKRQKHGFASFNHNFQDRHPEDFVFQSQVNSLLPQDNKIINYGGNTRQVGADVRQCSVGHGRYITLSPRTALEKILSLYCVVLFKENDWGSGVIWNTLITKTPVIVRKHYFYKTNLNKYFVANKHCIVIESPQEAMKELTEFNDDKFEFFQNNLIDLYSTLVNDDYWQRFKLFIENLQVFS